MLRLVTELSGHLFLEDVYIHDLFFGEVILKPECDRHFLQFALPIELPCVELLRF